MKAVFLDLARTVVEFSPGYHNELGSFLRSNGYCISDRDVFREIAKQRAWLHVAPDCQDNLALDFASLFNELTGELPETQVITAMRNVTVPAQAFTIYEDIPWFVEEASSSGLKVVLIAGSKLQDMEIVRISGIEDIVNGVVYGSYAGYPRRGSDVFHRAAAIAGSSGVFIGDTYEVDSVDAAAAELPFLLIDREDYYLDIRKNKATSMKAALNIILAAQPDEEKASCGECIGYPSPPDLFAPRKPRAVSMRGARLMALTHGNGSRHQTNTHLNDYLEIVP